MYLVQNSAGFSSKVDQHLLESAKLLTCPEHEKYVFILMDEMHLRENIVYDRHTGLFSHMSCIIYTRACSILHCAGSLIGFVDMGDINNHLQAFAQSLSSEKYSAPLATTMLVFMVCALRTQLKYPYAQFPCNSLSSDEIFDPFWTAVSRLQGLGFKVMGLCCDGLAANRRLFSLHSDKPNAYKIINPYAEDGRYLYFFSDPPHLMKTVRNAWANPKRHLWVCFQVLYKVCSYNYIEESFIMCSVKDRT